MITKKYTPFCPRVKFLPSMTYIGGKTEASKNSQVMIRGTIIEDGFIRCLVL